VSRLRAAFGGDRARSIRERAGRRRPTTRWGAAAVTAGILAFAALAVVALVVVLPAVYAEYGFHPETSAQSWASLTPQYADSSVCRRCHEAEYLPWQASKHAPVVCESCHGPLAEHAATAPVVAPPGTIEVEIPTQALCIACHEQVPGRPPNVAQVELASHYAGAPCLGCHDVHSATAKRPPEISHSLAGLPACITCHTPAGLKPVPVGHEPAADAVCRTCHKRPSGGE
jgi:hypothetical protein